jgi:adenosylmethionine-8-amino-7-oxononanoate aminotransferase
MAPQASQSVASGAVTDPSSPPAFLHPFAKPAAPTSSYLMMVSGEGATVTDAAGKSYVDALAGLWYCQVGHGRREIIEAIHAQAQQLATWHAFDRFTNEQAEVLTVLLRGLAPMADARVFLTSSGSEAVESAIKLARFAHHAAGDRARTIVISRSPSYHGVTFGSLALTGLPANQAGFGPLLGDVVQVPADDLVALDEAIATHGAERIAAIIAEPVIGAGGVLPPVDGYLAGLRERCDATGAFLILDEVICGFGRLGAWFGAERYGVRPDLVSFAKGVSSGYLPVGGVLVGAAVRERLEADPDLLLRHGHTYSGHPTACAAAVANVGILRTEGLFDRADAIGKRLADGLRSVAAGAGAGDRIVDVRGAGALWAVELAAGIDATGVRNGMLDRGVIPRNLGTSVVAFCPPLVISDEQIDRCVEALAEAVSAS